LKFFEFLINSNLFIALSAVTLTVASQVHFGWEPRLHPYLAVVFFATLADYNFHRIISFSSRSIAVISSKYTWAARHIPLIRMILAGSCIGLLLSLFFVTYRNLIFLAPLAAVTLIYSVSNNNKYLGNLHIKQIPGIKTLLLALVWSAVTIFLPVINTANTESNLQIMILFAQRFSFIFAIAIPFDIRDMDCDSKNGIKTIPMIFGEAGALRISGFALLLSLAFALFSYSENQALPQLAGYLISIIFAGIVIFSKKLLSKRYYYHGILDGSILVQGILMIISYYL